MSRILKGSKPNYRIEIQGNVQGVGFRPLVYRAAKSLGLSGNVINTGKGVIINLSSNRNVPVALLSRIKAGLPHHAKIQKILIKQVPGNPHTGFRILSSEKSLKALADIPPDLSICPSCLNELLDKSDRRFHYPFINCTECGPRFTITKKVPYDRINTTMAEFDMCPDCKSEYKDPSTRRFHAQPDACPVCCPKIRLVTKSLKVLSENEKALVYTIKFLAEGKIVAIKSLGGYHLACDALNGKAVESLRKRKRRPHKPFAVMARDLETARKYADINKREEKLLSSFERPIVLLKKKNSVPENISPDNAYIGIMLPYTPLHILLFSKKASYDLLVMTSGNKADEPICSNEKEVKEKLSGIADYFLIHNRKIYNRCDDSIIFNFNGREDGDVFIRRSRGYVPKGIEIKKNGDLAVLGVGAEMKNTFCLTRNNKAYVSQYIGDMDNSDSLEFYKEALLRFKNYLSVRPKVIARDLHPDYMTSVYTENIKRKDKKLKVIEVQHHKAHIASVAAEHRINKPLLGFAFDGTGYGSDGRVWGGECFLYKNNDILRIAHFDNFSIPGGEAAIKEIWRLGLSLLARCGIRDIPAFYNSFPKMNIERMIENKINSPECSSVGRIFDAIASIINIRQVATFEAQAAIELESIALDTSVKKGYNFDIFYDEKTRCSVISVAKTVNEILTDKKKGISNNLISAKFHFTIAEIILFISKKYRNSHSINDIALSGGVFQNRVLLSKAVELLKAEGFNVYWNKLVPPNDGGISLGQAYLATQKGSSRL